MAHPSAVLRGRVVTVPVSTAPGDSDAFTSDAVRTVQALDPDSHVLATLSDPPDAGALVLTLSGDVEHPLSEWQSVLEGVMRTHGVHADWNKALVLRPEPDSSHEH
jgi:hypothetical protein